MAQDTESTVIGVRVAESRRDELEAYVGSHDEYQSVPDLFRHAVAHELSDDYGLLTAGAGGPDTDPTEDRVGEIATNVAQLRNDIGELAETVDTLADEIREGASSDILTAMSAIHKDLPVGEENAVSVDTITSWFDAEEQTIWNALIQLYEETGTVHRTDDGNWYRSE